MRFTRHALARGRFGCWLRASDMAGGIDWFRWHHGSVSDGKFALVAHKAGASVAEVIAVWACLLEAASAAEDRGNPGAVDFETMDFSLGLSEGKSWRIYERMRERALLDGGSGRIAQWEKRQPKREDDTAAERKRRQREREHELQMAERVTGSESRSVTQGHSYVTHGHDREEKSREEEKEPKTKTARKRAAPAVLVSLPDLVAEGVDEQHATDWLVVRKAKSLPLTPTAWDEVKAEAVKAGISVGDAVKAATVNGWGGFKAVWLQQPVRNGPAGSAFDRKAAEASKWMTLTAPVPGFDFVDVEATDAAPLSLR